MWTLYDPLARKSQPKVKSGESKVKAYRASASRVPTTMEKLWFLMEPTGPLTCRTESRGGNS